jgi:hypothetical protein
MANLAIIQGRYIFEEDKEGEGLLAASRAN